MRIGQASFKFVAFTVPAILILAGVFFVYTCSFMPKEMRNDSPICGLYGWLIFIGIIILFLELIFVGKVY